MLHLFILQWNSGLYLSGPRKLLTIAEFYKLCIILQVVHHFKQEAYTTHVIYSDLESIYFNISEILKICRCFNFFFKHAISVTLRVAVVTALKV